MMKRTHPQPGVDDATINHPPHYTRHPSGVECITIVEHYNFNVGNAIKYLWRAGLKTGNTARTQKDVHDRTVEDLCKAEWYIRQEIERLTKSETS